MKSGLFLLLSSSAALAATFPVSMTNVRFTPASLTINAGDTVTWNDQQGFHDTVSGSSGVPNGLWNSSAQFGRIMQPGESYSVTFNNPGTFPYYCSPHWPLGMVGSVQVIAANSPPGLSIVSPANGANFAAPADITVQANAFDSDGSVTQVQFSLNGTPIGTLSAPPYSVTVNDLGPGNYTFSAAATDNAGATGSASVSVTVSGQQPAITSAPPSQTVNGGSDVTFTVQATGSSPLNYQWFFGQAAIEGATTPSLLLPNVSSADSGIYTVQVANSFGSTSVSATLTVTNPPAGTPPSITTQPESQTVGPGTNVTFNAAAIGSSPLSWQWYFQGAPFVGATNSALNLLSVMPANAGQYFAVVSNAFGSATSIAATLTVMVPPVCEYTLSKSSVAFDAAGGFDNVTVTTTPNCSWTVSNTNSWIVIISGNSGLGSGTVNFTVLSNATRTARSGVLILAGITLTVTQSAPVFVARNDFNRDGQSDFLWQHTDGRLRLWLLDGAARVRPMLLRNGRPVSRALNIVGTHDFNADRNVDILWQHTSGAISIWFMNGTNFLRSGVLSGAPALASSWQVAGLGDFDQDGRADFLFRHKDGYLLVWFMKGTRFVRQLLIFNGQAVPPAWRVAGVADVNNDRQPDIVWQHTDSSIVVWFMNGTTPAGGPLLSNLPRLNAKIVGLNDLNQDGKLDFIWRYPAGQLSMWLMDGTNRLGSFFLKSPEPLPSAWKFAAPRD